MSREELIAELKALAVEAEACRRCPLGGIRTQAVFARGDPEAEVAFIGEAPGFHEDQQGRPFVGAAGQLLDKLTTAKLGISPSKVWVMNVLKCRPPGNRDPLPEEIEACRPFLERQLELVRPRLVVTLGNFASRLLLDTQTGITKLRGRRFPFRDLTLIPTFHPAAALRGGNAARGIEEDFEEIARALQELRDAGDEPAADPDPGQQLGLF